MAASDQAKAAPPAAATTPHFDEATFETMLQRLRDWKEKHWGDTIVPRKVPPPPRLLSPLVGRLPCPSLPAAARKL